MPMFFFNVLVGGHARKCGQCPQTTSKEPSLFSLQALLCAGMPADMDSSKWGI